MTQSETNETAPRRSGKVLAGIIISQIVFILLIAGTVILGTFLNLLGGWTLSFYTVILFAPLFLLIPMVITWVAYGKRNMKLAVTLTIGMIVFACAELLAIAGMFGFLSLISSGP